MTISTVINLKGGTGKTVTATTLAALLAEDGQRVLVIDADPQHNTTDFYRSPPPQHTLADVMQQERCDYTALARSTSNNGIDILPADINLVECDIDSALHGDGMERMRAFADALSKSGRYDAVIIDCPPSFTALSVAALSVADDVIMPVKVDAYALGGVLELTAQINSIRRLRPGIRARALVTMWRNEPAITQGEALLRRSGIDVYAARIRYSPKVDEATFARRAVTDYSPQSAASRDYRAFYAEWRESHGQKQI